MGLYVALCILFHAHYICGFRPLKPSCFAIRSKARMGMYFIKLCNLTLVPVFCSPNYLILGSIFVTSCMYMLLYLFYTLNYHEHLFMIFYPWLHYGYFRNGKFQCHWCFLETADPMVQIPDQDVVSKIIQMDTIGSELLI